MSVSIGPAPGAPVPPRGAPASIAPATDRALTGTTPGGDGVKGGGVRVVVVVMCVCVCVKGKWGEDGLVDWCVGYTDRAPTGTTPVCVCVRACVCVCVRACACACVRACV